MPAAAHAIPRTSERVLHNLLQYKLGWSRPVWVSLRIQRDCVNPGIRSPFLSDHHRPFLSTRRIYPHDPQNALFTATSHDEPGKEEDKIAPLLSRM